MKIKCAKKTGETPDPPSTKGPLLCQPSIDIRIGTQVLQDFLPLFLVDHQINARTVVARLDAALRTLE